MNDSRTEKEVEKLKDPVTPSAADSQLFQRTNDLDAP